MDTDRKWIVVRIDGKIAAVSTDYRALAGITSRLAAQKHHIYNKVCAETVDFDYIWELRGKTKWEDLMLFGTDFQKRVWRKLWEMVRTENETGQVQRKADLMSYSDFADLCQNRAGVRAVAHAIGLNPVSVIIPCHLVIPKETIDRISDIHKKAQSTIFKGDDLCLDSLLQEKGVDFGEYSLGRELKRQLILRELQ